MVGLCVGEAQIKLSSDPHISPLTLKLFGHRAEFLSDRIINLVTF